MAKIFYKKLKIYYKNKYFWKIHFYQSFSQNLNVKKS